MSYSRWEDAIHDNDGTYRWCAGVPCCCRCSIVSNPNLRGLRHLDLSTGSMGETSANDATMAAIAANLTALSGLRVGGTKVTEAGKQLVMAACPGVKIY